MAEKNENGHISRLDDLFRDGYKELFEKYKSKRETFFLPTGFKNLDNLIGGWYAGELVIIGARPGFGKTSLLISMLRNITQKSPHRVAFISFENSKRALMERIILSDSGIPISSLIKTGINEEEMNKLLDAYIKAGSSQTYLVDDSGEDLEKIIDTCRELVKKHQVKILMLDYLQAISDGKKHITWHLAYHIIQSFKKLVSKLNVVIILASQLSRDVEKRAGSKRPVLADLHCSGTLEEYADKVLLIHRPELYGIDIDENGNSLAGVAEIIVAKNRSGRSGSIRLLFDEEYGNFYEDRKRVEKTWGKLGEDR